MRHRVISSQSSEPRSIAFKTELHAAISTSHSRCCHDASTVALACFFAVVGTPLGGTLILLERSTVDGRSVKIERRSLMETRRLRLILFHRPLYTRILRCVSIAVVNFRRGNLPSLRVSTILYIYLASNSKKYAFRTSGVQREMQRLV